MTYQDSQRRAVNRINQAKWRARHPEHRALATQAMREHRARKRAKVEQMAPTEVQSV